jgi:hypothetical protein
VAVSARDKTVDSPTLAAMGVQYTAESAATVHSQIKENVKRVFRVVFFSTYIFPTFSFLVISRQR